MLRVHKLGQSGLAINLHKLILNFEIGELVLNYIKADKCE